MRVRPRLPSVRATWLAATLCLASMVCAPHAVAQGPATPDGCEATPESAAQTAVVRVAVMLGLRGRSTVLVEGSRCERLYVGRRRVNLVTAPRRATRAPVVGRATATQCLPGLAAPCFTVEVRGATAGCTDAYLAYRLLGHWVARFLERRCGA